MMEYRLVPMDRSHVDQVSALERLCFSAPWSKEVLIAELYKDSSFYLVAEEEGTGRVLGCAGLFVLFGEGSIDNVAVHPDCRRRGIARRMMEVFVRFAAEKLESLTLEVRQSNEAAIALYEGMGFGQVGLRRNYYIKPKENAILMTRRFQNEAETTDPF